MMMIMIMAVGVSVRALYDEIDSHANPEETQAFDWASTVPSYLKAKNEEQVSRQGPSVGRPHAPCVDPATPPVACSR
jgi:hypothetical protein